ncbi:bifunctional metallophosphatase/5'-nucleotidase [Maridesulfovibrio hydrothermalis]|uniref:5'-Nucleotidase domain protein n=1 Tax=Maridesulfovibrio hydrothermalis AM13 = DSM 14728 TaxID=1121451 RepID=L0RDP7_9BACT|nr:bifunctional UDP-sugar hydrolase/5'-nucleotidase [Maridesulfovibrio hydrothermalis]CCO24342.1 5'-Nucleotidase domain protein [Maridesulfovibrio hydrothermalis AM13 = DSM 14728]
MRYYIIITAIFTILLTPSSGFAARWDLVFLTTSGLNGQLLPAKEEGDRNNPAMVRTFGGFARIHSIFESYRKKYPDITFTVATGDDLMGESLTNQQGKVVFGTMNMMGFDVSTLGNHEFDRGSNFLVKCLNNKKFPTVLSNINIAQNNRLQKYIQKSIIIEKNFLKVGFMGMMLPDLTMISNPGSGISINPDIIKSARTTALKLKREDNADLIILLSHLTLKDQKKILEAVPEIDIICGGQSHKDIFPGQEIIARDAPTPGLMVQCGDHGRYVGILKIKMANDAIGEHEWTMIPITDQTKPKKEILDYINSQLEGKNSHQIVATSKIALDTKVGFIRTRTAPIGQLVSSIIRDKFKTDIAFQNSGGIRGDNIIPAGPVNGEDINAMFPFGNTVTVLKVTGKTIKQILERSVHKLPEPSGAFLQTSGLHYTLDLKKTPQSLEINSIGKPVKIKVPGSRISNIKIKDESGKFRKIKPDQKYSIATNSYLTRGGDGYIMLGKSPEKVETFIKVRDVIKSGLLDMKEVNINSKPNIFDTAGQPFFE